MAQSGPLDLAALLPRERQQWMGDELLRVLGFVQTKDSRTGQDLVCVFEAARRDAKRQESQRKYTHAASSYKYAWNIAQRLQGLPLDVVKELLIGLSDVSLKIKDVQTAFASANECIHYAPNFSKGYKLMSEVGVATSDPSLAVRALLDGMVRCSLSDDETVDFVVNACQQIVRTNSLAANLYEITGIQPKLPDAPQIWKKILQRLFDSKSFAALALVTSGLTDHHISTRLDSAAKNVDVDCSQMNVEKVVDTLNKQQVKAWGAELAIFIIDHGGQIGRDTQGPFVQRLVQLAVKTECCKVIRHVLEKKNWQRKRDINQQNSLGSTGLHVAVMSTSGVLLAELVSLLLDNGACSNIRDKEGKMPRDYVTQNPSVVKKLNQSHSFESIKAKGNDAHKNQKHSDAVRFYKEAVKELSGEKCGSHHHRDLAVLHCNMATSFMAMNKKAEGKNHAQKSIKADPTYFKPYFRLGKILVKERQQKDACDVFCKGLFCEATIPADRVEFLVEIALLLPHLTDEDRILKRVSTHLKECWPKLFAALCQKNYWDVICRLVLGPPFRDADALRTDGWSFDGWHFSDQYTTDQRIRVGHAISFEPKTTTSIASILDAVKGQTSTLFKNYATDLVLALLLQGAELESLLQKSSESCYHVALRLCCLTGKLGLMRYILSEEPHLKEALKAVDDEGKSLLHLACVLDSSTTIGEQVILLLFEKGFDPLTKDSSGKQAVFYLTPDSSTGKLFRTDTPKTAASSRSTPQQAASGKDSHSTADKRESPVSSSCRSCSKLLGYAKKSFKKNTDIAEAVTKLVQLFACQHSPSIGGNIELEQGALDLLVTNLTTSRLEKDIPSIIFELPETRLQLAVQSMVEYRRWEELKVFLRRGEKQGRSLASKVSVSKHVISKETSSFPDKEVFDMLLCHGAKLTNEEYDSVVQTALERSQMNLVEVLLCAKKDCKDFSPVHAAFDIALFKVKGNFTLFDNLRLRYDSRAKNEEGNTLLHLALKAVASSHSQEAVERLVRLGLVQDDLNNEKMMAVDYLKKGNDKRADILINHFITGMVKLSDEELQVARARKDKWLEVNRPEKSKKTSARDKHLQGAEGGKDPSTKASGPQPRTAENKQQIKEGEQSDDLKFEGLLWEVVLTEEVHRKLNSKKVPPHTREKIINIIKQLASGETRRKDFRELPNAKPIRLYEANITRGERLIYEIAVDFSPSQKVYTDVIRVWDIVLDHDKIFQSVKRIKDSHKRGEGCKSWVKLKALPDPLGAHKDLMKPRTYTKVDGDTERGDTTVYPPASADETEYQILKFFTVTSNMELAWLQKSDVKTDFLFRVTEREVVIIELDTGAPVLLIGRSGTGKTTCCLYRLMICFLKYWTDTREKGYQPQLTFRECFARVKDHGEADGKQSELRGTEEAPTGGAGSVDGACGGVPEESEHDQPFVPNTSRCKAKQREMETMTTTSSARLIAEKVHLHQMFVTKNPVLCEAVQKNFKELCHAEPVAERHTAVEEEPLPHRLQEVDDYQFPLFLTLWKLILMLDASLPPPHFFKRHKDGSLTVTLPEESSAIHYLHGYMSEEESDEDEEEEEETGKARPSRKQHSLESDPRRKVTYELFVEEIWPHLKKGETAGYHPSLVWMEITSFIKGSLEAVNSPNGYLDYKSYEEVGRKQAPNFVGDRQKIYTLFESYRKYIHQKWMYDEADLLFHIFRRLRNISLGHSQPKNPEESEQLGPEWVIHEIYVDETQDFTQAELFLLMCLTDQPNRMFLTGDTAQSIMRGVAFRFTDLKTLFYRAKDMSVLSGHSQLQVPKRVYKLTQNYRSHDGILRLASGILDLLYNFFPESFDKLARDKGLFGGPKPVLIESASPADLVTFLAGNERETSHIEFGAHQVILVVSDDARKALPEEMSRALRLTIYEAKGLEFDDVLLYNFFKDSQAKKEWQIVLSYIDKLCSAAAENKDEKTSSSAGGLVCTHEDELRRRPTASRDFDEKKYKILNSELKHLYTAVTRARANVYIFDEDEEKRRPMFEYFKRLQLAESKDTLYCSGVGAQDSFAKKSSPKAWEKRGTEFMNRKQYDIAAGCYSNAGNELLRNIAIAHSRLNTALMQPQSRILDDATKTAYLKAAILFLECQAESQKKKQTSEQRFYLATEGACRCLDKAGKHGHAAEVFEKNRKLREAAIQYEKAERWEQASMCHEQMLDYHRALTCLVRGKLFDKALDCLQRFGIEEQKCKDSKEQPQKVMVKPGTEFTVENLRLRKAEECLKSGEEEEMLRTLDDAHPEEQIAFLQKNSRFDIAAKKMFQEGARSEAVWLLLHNGMIVEAIELAEESKDIELRAHCYLNKARRLIHSEASSEKESTNTGFGKPKNTVPETWDKDFRKAEQLLDEALKLFKQCSKHNEAGECLLLLAQLKVDKNYVFNALEFFQQKGHLAAVLECYETLYKPADPKECLKMDKSACQHLLEGMDYSSELVLLLLDGEHSNSQYLQCLHFFGLDVPDSSSLTFYPCLNPRWLKITKKKRKSNTETLSGKDRMQALKTLATFLAQRAMGWYQDVHDFIERGLKQEMQCPELQSSSKCSHHPTHKEHFDDRTEVILKLLADRVWLDQSAASFARYLPTTTTQDIDVFTKPFESVERLLSFILPKGLPRYRMTSVYRFCWQIQERKSRMYRRVYDQIERYIHHLTQPVQGSLEEDGILKEQCRTTKWIVQASLISILFGLQDKVENFCSEVELQLTKIPKRKAQRWMRNTREYAVWADKELDIRMHLARRYLDAVSYLLGLNTKESSGRFNPYEALVKFTQFIKLLADRRQAQQMPDLHAFLFWIEIFTTLGLYLVDKCSGSHTVNALPACYFRNLHMLNLVEPGGQDTLQVWMENHNPRDSNNKASRKFVLGRIQYLTRVLCGVRQGDFSLLGYLSKLDKKEPSHFLLLERALVVSLVLLLNCCLEGVSEEHLVPILRTVKGVCENTQGMPDRLKSLAESLRDAQDYCHVFKALESTLEGMGEQLQFYRWHWKERGSMPQVERKPNIPQGPLPSLEMVLKKETGEGQGPQASESIQDGLNQHAQNEDVQEEDEEMVSTEDRANLKQRLLDRRVANAISCWKEFVKRNREKKISGDRDLDIMTLFPLNPITETTCGICGESYEQASVDEMEIQTEDVLEDEGMIPAVSKATRLTQRQEHENSWEHLQQHSEYQEFREVCQKRIARPLHDAGHFFSNIQIEKKAALYKTHPHEFHSYEKYKKVRQAVQHAIANQNWGEQESLCQQVAELQVILTDRKVKTIFHNIFNDNENSQGNRLDHETSYSLRNVADFLR